jgi:DNA-binding transcriptional ArsR family regulator
VTAEPVGDTFFALADPTRRRVVSLLSARPSATASELARELPVSRQALAKHLSVLHDAGLAEPTRAGRETRYRLTPGPLVEAAGWMAQVGSDWDRRLARLAKLASPPRAAG